MREIKIFIIVAVIVGVIYWGVEPLAHSIMHPSGAPVDFAYKDLDKFGKFDISKGDVAKGKDSFATACASCHGLESQGIKAPMDDETAGTSFGVVPPDLSDMGYMIDHNFLAHFIKDPVRAAKLSAKFQVDCSLDKDQANCEKLNENKAMFPMMAASGLGLSDEDVTNITAYLVSIAPKAMSDKAVFINACNRCHAVEYDKGQYDNIFDKNAKSGYGDALHAHTKAEFVEKYLGAKAPDLSMMIRSRGEHYLHDFINNPQNVPLADIRNAILNSMLNEAKNKEKDSLANLPQEQKVAKSKEIDLKTIEDYKITLPKNTMKDEWQSDDNYTNLALQMGVMPVGKSMPRFGLNEKAQAQVVKYLEQVGDSKKEQRENVGYYLIGISILLAIIAYFWKLKIWRDLH